MIASRRLAWSAPLLVAALLILTGLACSRSSSEVIYITATPLFDANGNMIVPPTMTSDTPTDTPIVPTPNPTRVLQVNDSGLYAVQAGDTLGSIATAYGLTVDELVAANALSNADVLEVNQLLTIPGGSLAYTSDFKIIPDSELIYSAAASDFSTEGAVKFRQGFLAAYSEDVGGTLMSGIELVDFIASNYSVNPRLLLALLEYRGKWLSEPYPSEPYDTYPLGIVSTGREGLYKQLLDAADALNQGYYGWKYRGGTSLVVGAQRLYYATSLNPGTVGVQYMLSLTTEAQQWQRDIHPDGFYATYVDLFGDPFAHAVEPLTPADLTQPVLALPIPTGEEWVYTGGPHGAYNSGSAWAAIDLAPPEPPEELVAAQGSCYISPYQVVAAASGVIARSGSGYVILDLDMDGNEFTGWTLVYLHIDDYERIPAGTVVQAGDPLGHPSCQGGYSTGTHLHFARRYNGEWIPVECIDCAPGVTVPPLVLGEWTFHAFTGQEYQGYMTRAGDDGYRQADQMRDYEGNKVMW